MGRIQNRHIVEPVAHKETPRSKALMERLTKEIPAETFKVNTLLKSATSHTPSLWLTLGNQTLEDPNFSLTLFTTHTWTGSPLEDPSTQYSLKSLQARMSS